MDKDRSPAPLSGASALWLISSLLVILVATLPPRPSASVSQNGFFHLSLLDQGAVWFDIVRNLVLYAPYGVALGTRVASFAPAAFIAAATALSIEVLQFSVPGRDPALVDVLANSVGAILGFGAAHILARTVKWVMSGVERGLLHAADPTDRVAARLSLAAASACAVTVIMIGWLALPDYARATRYMVTGPSIDALAGKLRIGNNQAGTRPFRGLIDEVRVYSRAIGPQEVISDMNRPVDSTDRSMNGLLFAYGFSSDDSIAFDESGNGQHGTRTGVVHSDGGRFGAAALFAGSGGSIATPEGRWLDLAQGLTLAAWVFPRDTVPFNGVIISHDADAYYLRASTSGNPFIPSAGARFGGVPRTVWFERPLEREAWSHVATTYDGEVFRLFVNGELVSSAVIWSADRPKSVTLNGSPIRAGPLGGAAEIRRLLTRGFTLRLSGLSCGARRPAPAPIFSITANGDVEAMSLWVSGSDIWIRSTTLSQRLSLEAPRYRAREALPACEPGQSRDIEVHGPLQRVRVEVDGVEMSGMPLSFMAGWQLLVPSEPLPEWGRLLCILGWAFLLFAPFAYWARLSLPTLFGLLAVVGSIAAAQHIWRTPLPNNLQLVAVGIACALGLIANRVIRARRAGS